MLVTKIFVFAGFLCLANSEKNIQKEKRQVIFTPLEQTVVLHPLVLPISPTAPSGPTKRPTQGTKPQQESPGNNNSNFTASHALQCGMPFVNCRRNCVSRVPGGIPALADEFPWMVKIYSYKTHICGGTLIDRQHVLTSARCLEPTTPESVGALRLVFGEYNKDRPNLSQKVTRNVVTAYVHSNYRGPTIQNLPENNIAVLKLDKPVQFSRTIQPVCLDDGSYRVDNGVTEALSVGHGVLSYSNNPMTTTPHKVSVKVLTPQSCQNSYARYQVSVRKQHICAGLPENPCVGDEGGPLVVRDREWKLVGILSFGVSCNGPAPIFSRVSLYKNWIQLVQKGFVTPVF